MVKEEKGNIRFVVCYAFSRISSSHMAGKNRELVDATGIVLFPRSTEKEKGRVSLSIFVPARGS